VEGRGKEGERGSDAHFLIILCTRLRLTEKRGAKEEREKKRSDKISVF